MTLDQAQHLTQGQWIYSNDINNCKGGPARVKVLSIKTWKRSPNKVLVSCRYAMKAFFKLGETMLHRWEIDEETAIKVRDERGVLCQLTQ